MVPPPSPPAPYHLFAGGKWIRTIGPPPEIVVDPSGSRRDHRAKYGCLSARPRVRCLCPPGKTQHLHPKSVFDRPGSDRWNVASTTFFDAGPMVRMQFPPAASHNANLTSIERMVAGGSAQISVVHSCSGGIDELHRAPQLYPRQWVYGLSRRQIPTRLAQAADLSGL